MGMSKWEIVSSILGLWLLMGLAAAAIYSAAVAAIRLLTDDEEEMT